MSKWLEIRFRPDQVDLQDAVLEHFQDCRHPTPRDIEPGIRLSVPYRADAEEFLNGLGLAWKEIMRPGRAPQGKAQAYYTIDKDVSDYISSIPLGERSKFVNSILREGIEKVKRVSGQS